MNNLERIVRNRVLQFSLCSVSLLGLASCGGYDNVTIKIIDCNSGPKTGQRTIYDVQMGEEYPIGSDKIRVNKNSLSLLPASGGNSSDDLDANEVTFLPNGLTMTDGNSVFTATLQTVNDQKSLLFQGSCNN